MRQSDSNPPTMPERWISEVFKALATHHGPQSNWWPAVGPLEIAMGALLVQRTTWRSAERALENLKHAGLLSIEALASAAPRRLESLVKPAGFYRTKAARLCAFAQFLQSSGGFSELEKLDTRPLRERLLAQPGIGDETADAILGFAFKRPVFVVDAYARRLFERLEAPFALQPDAALKACIESTLVSNSALNELHALIITHGKRYCRPRPSCHDCPLFKHCNYASAAVQRIA